MVECMADKSFCHIANRITSSLQSPLFAKNEGFHKENQCGEIPDMGCQRADTIGRCKEGYAFGEMLGNGRIVGIVGKLGISAHFFGGNRRECGRFFTFFVLSGNCDNKREMR